MSTGAKKNDALDAKIRTDLFPPTALLGISAVFTYGAEKYDDWNWAKGLKYSRLYGALQRHMAAWFSGQDNDPETGMSHLWHAGCCITMLIHTQQLIQCQGDDDPLDDRPSKFHSQVMLDSLATVLKRNEAYQQLVQRKQKSKPDTLVSETNIDEALHPEDYKWSIGAQVQEYPLQGSREYQKAVLDGKI